MALDVFSMAPHSYELISNVNQTAIHCLKVPGGWIYTFTKSSLKGEVSITSTFVPQAQ